MKTVGSIFLLFSFIFVTSCSDIFVPDISNEKVSLITPINGYNSSSKAISFYWNALPDAISYNIQVVSPSFDSIINIVIDSTVTSARLSAILDRGQYEWNVVAINDAYNSTVSETYKLYVAIDSSENLSNQVLNLLLPQNDIFTNNNNISFSWSSLTAAQNYNFQLGSQDFSSLLFQRELTNNSVAYNILTDGTYYWRVRGENNNTNTFTPWSIRKIVLDRIPPSPPLLIAPTNGESIDITQQNPDFRWTSANDILADSIFIFANESRDTLIFEASTINRRLNLDDFGSLPSRSYFWGVKSVDKASYLLASKLYDKAGNVSALSEIRKFNIKD